MSQTEADLIAAETQEQVLREFFYCFTPEYLEYSSYVEKGHHGLTYGPNHGYGYWLNQEVFEAIKRGHQHGHHQHHNHHYGVHGHGGHHPDKHQHNVDNAPKFAHNKANAYTNTNAQMPPPPASNPRGSNVSHRPPLSPRGAVSHRPPLSPRGAAGGDDVHAAGGRKAGNNFAGGKGGAHNHNPGVSVWSPDPHVHPSEQRFFNPLEGGEEYQFLDLYSLIKRKYTQKNKSDQKTAMGWL